MNLFEKKTRANKEKNSERTFHTAIFLVFLFSIVIVVCLWGTRLIKKDHYTHVTDGNFYQYMGENRIEYSGKISIEKLEDDDRSVLTSNGMESDIDGTPLYYSDDEKLITLKESIYQDPETYSPLYVDAYTEISLKDDVPWAKVNDKMIHLNGGFLYDGKDMYIFLEPVTIFVNDEIKELNSLSYCNLTYGLELILYDYSSNEYEQKEVKQSDSITAEFTDGRVLDLNGDILYDSDGDWQLLVTTPDVSKPLK